MKRYLKPLMCILFLASCRASNAPLPTVAQVDLARYTGTWYEIASVANRFQQGCVATRAEYSLNDDGTIGVFNSCRDNTLSGKERSVHGTAWVENRASNAELKVQFFWPFTGDYNILELDPNYQFALVGTKSRKYFWILSRARTLDAKVTEHLLARAGELGFNASSATYTLQPDE